MSRRLALPTLFLLLVALLGSSQAPAGELTRELEAVLAETPEGGTVAAIVVMEAFPEQGKLLAELAGKSRENRRRLVVERMQTLARESQAELRLALAEDGTSVAKLRVLWGINGIALEASPELLRAIAARDDVRSVLFDARPPMESVLDAEAAATPPSAPFVPTHRGDGDGPTGGDTSGPNPNADVAEWLVAMQIKRVWDELGYTGAGVIVAVIDDGVDRTHPDVADHVWTNTDELPDNGVDDDGNGYVDDMWGWDFADGDNDPTKSKHGMAAAGQIVGDGTNGWVTGGAPDAEFIALRVGSAPSDWWAASDYAIESGAHIISQSLSKKWTQQPDYEAFRRQTDTELAAGVLHFNSTGNTGLDTDKPVPYNVSTPGNCPAPWSHPDQTLAGGVSSVIGAANIDWETDAIADSSPYGPAAWEDIQANTDPGYPHTVSAEFQDYPYENGARMGLLKPDIAAYGTGTWSLCNDGGIQDSYCGFGGTSSATPHLAGVGALLLSAYPDATPAEIAEAMLTTAEHRGDPGKNNRYGVGLVQAYDAVLRVAPPLLFESFAVDDVEQGNGDGALDPGERLTLRVTLNNRGAAPLDDIEARLSTETTGVTVHNAWAHFGSLAAGTSQESLAPHFGITIDGGLCATKAVFALELHYAGQVRTVWFRARIGDEVPLVFLDDDFETDSGWVSDPGTASRGAWVREDPIGTTLDNGEPSNPEDDASPDGTMAWVTGNGELSGTPGADNNDVDGGEVRLFSPVFGSAAPLVALNLKYERWSASTQFILRIDDYFHADITNDGGSNWSELERSPSQTNFWLFRRFNLLLVTTPSANMQLRFRMYDHGDDDTVEAALDEVLLEGLRVDCEAFTPAATQAPHGIGDTLRVAKRQGSALLSWQVPPVDPAHDAATLYTIERGVEPAGARDDVGTAMSTGWLDAGEDTGSGALRVYVVRAANGAGEEMAP